MLVCAHIPNSKVHLPKETTFDDKETENIQAICSAHHGNRVISYRCWHRV